MESRDYSFLKGIQQMIADRNEPIIETKNDKEYLISLSFIWNGTPLPPISTKYAIPELNIDLKGSIEFDYDDYSYKTPVLLIKINKNDSPEIIYPKIDVLVDKIKEFTIQNGKFNPFDKEIKYKVNDSNVEIKIPIQYQ